mmetsp:Transcript_18526/g.26165  ORF Transcript_18526/g.26165 Transcript_18526/m.26165 type:complete len:556 (+) Transcript_18526:113-1780(+)
MMLPQNIIRSSRLSSVVLSCLLVAASASASVTTPQEGKSTTTTTTTTNNNNNDPQQPLLRHKFPPGMISKAQVPDTGKDWVTLDNGVEFQPGPGYTFGHATRILAANYNNAGEEEGNSYGATTFYEANPFIEGTDIEFDEGQQAWRFVGWWIDCNEFIRGAYGHPDDDEGSHGSNSQDYEDDGCQRYLMWAAYIDPYYEGGGIGEYQYYDTYNNQWDATSCNYGEAGSGDKDGDGDGARCAKMDCHEEDTQFELLGLFKHADYDEWFDQLFKHTGYCVWDSNAYEFMQAASRNIPRGCRDTGSTDTLGNTLYYALKPLSDGGMTIGIYKDTKCVEEYGGWSSLDSVLGGNILSQASHDSGDDDATPYYAEYSLSQALDEWTKHFDVWKVCHPCVAANLGNVGWNADDDASKGDRYEGYFDDGYFDDGYNGNDQDDFDCNDDAGYTNVNQCMKFMAKTNLMTATFQDYTLGTQQGSLEELHLSGYTEETAGDKYYSHNVFSKSHVGAIDMGTKILFALSTITLVASIIVYYMTKASYQKKKKTAANVKLDTPLVLT